MFAVQIGAHEHMALDVIGRAFDALLRKPQRHGAGRKTLYTVWKNVAPEHRNAAPVVAWPDPLTRQCRRQLERMQGKVVRRRQLVERRKALSVELKAWRRSGLSLDTFRARQAEIAA